LIRSTDMPVPVEPDAGFGNAVAIAPLRSGLFQAASIVIGVPVDTVDGMISAGSVWVVHATANRPDPSTAQRWAANAGLAIGPAGTLYRFGETLAAGDFNGDGSTDLAIGVPLHDGVDVQAGAVQVLYQSEFIFRNGFQ
jgi:hypothetical protein